ncbi:MAG: protein-disulfide reductase DsbD, partial [Paraperlucidibaca sp.]
MTRSQSLLTFVLVCVLAVTTSVSQAAGLFSTSPRQGEFLPVEQAFVPSVLADDGDLVLHFAITPGHYLYDKQFQLKWADGSIAPMLPAFTVSSAGETHDDPTFGRVTIYRDDIDLTIAPPVHEATGIVELQVRYQGCADAGLCYPPEVWRVPVDLARWQPQLVDAAVKPALPSSDATQAASENTAPKRSIAPDANNASALAQWLATASFPLVLGAFLLLGLGLAFTPCVLPMLPILSAIIAGQKTPSARQGFLLALSYVLGMSIMYTIAGLLIASLGAAANISALLQNPTVLISFALVFVALAIMLWQGRAIALPQAWQDRLNQAQQQQRGGVYGSVFVMGAISSVIVSPCVSAPLAGVMLFLSTSQDAVLGASALFALSMGMGLPLLVLGAGGGRLIPKAGGWMDSVKRLFAWGLVAVAASMVLRLVSPAQAQIGWGVFFGLTALGLVSISSQRRMLGLLLATAVMAFAGSLVWSGAQGGHQLLTPWQIPEKAAQSSTGED